MSERWDRFYLGLAKFWSTKSKDPSTKVGAVLVNWDHQQEFCGYNGFAKGVLDLPERLELRDLKYKYIVHAEVNAITKALRCNMAKGSTLYVYPAFMLPPICHDCAKFAVQAGIKEVVGYNPDYSNARWKRWEESIGISQTMFTEAGITWRGLDECIN